MSDMYKETRISIETATLASNKGFSPILLGSNFREYLPTQSVLARWLRENHSIYINLAVEDGRWYWKLSPVIFEFSLREILSEVNRYTKKTDWAEIEFDSYEEALEMGLQKALGTIKK